MTISEIVALATLCSDVRKKLDKINEIVARLNPSVVRVPISTLNAIKSIVAETYNMTPAQLNEKCNERQFVVPRQVGFYLSRKLTNHSYPQIGEYYGGFHHTTVMHAVDKVKDMMFMYPDYKKRVEEIEAKVLEMCEGERGAGGGVTPGAADYRSPLAATK